MVWDLYGGHALTDREYDTIDINLVMHVVRMVRIERIESQVLINTGERAFEIVNE